MRGPTAWRYWVVGDAAASGVEIHRRVKTSAALLRESETSRQDKKGTGSHTGLCVWSTAAQKAPSVHPHQSLSCGERGSLGHPRENTTWFCCGANLGQAKVSL